MSIFGNNMNLDRYSEKFEPATKEELEGRLERAKSSLLYLCGKLGAAATGAAAFAVLSVQEEQLLLSAPAIACGVAIGAMWRESDRLVFECERLFDVLTDPQHAHLIKPEAGIQNVPIEALGQPALDSSIH